MKNWKDIGEVPDSEDESFDGLDDLEKFEESRLPGSSPAPLDGQFPKELPTGTNTVDIWDIPSSRESGRDDKIDKSAGTKAEEGSFSLHHATTSLLRRHNADADDIALASEAGQILATEGPLEASVISNTYPSHKPTGITDGESKPPAHSHATFPQRDITSSPLTSLSNLTSLDSSPLSGPFPEEILPPVPDLPALDELPPHSHPDPDETESEKESRLDAHRGWLRLRPRKPIQQHPYRIEGAQYASMMRAGGVKPVRVVRDPEAGRSYQDDSQEKATETEESQAISAEQKHGTGDDSGPMIQGDDAYDINESPGSSSPDSYTDLADSSRGYGDADARSVDDEDELPRLEDILSNSAHAKRRRARLGLPARKRLKISRQVPSSSSPPREFIQPHRLSSPFAELQNGAGPSSDLGATPRPRVQKTLEVQLFSRQSQSIRSMSSRSTTPAPGPTVDLTAIEDDSSDATSSSSESVEAETVRRHVRRIRGVLPASWLRLDQQKGRDMIQEPRSRRTPEHSPERTAPRRGVAIRRQGSPKSTSAPSFYLHSFSDEGEDEPTGLLLEKSGTAGSSTSSHPRLSVFDDADPGEAMEDNEVDRMAIGSKRQRISSDSGRSSKKQRAKSLFKGHSVQKTRQPRISQVLGKKKSMNSATGHNMKKSTARVEARTRKARVLRPHLLSILDVMEPQAPTFIKIAARAARRRKDLGKTSPSKKLISLATRADNVDALSVLQDWKLGNTQPKIPVPQLPRSTRQTQGRLPLGSLSVNTAGKPSSGHPSLSQPALYTMPRKFVRQTGLDGFVTINRDSSSQISQPLPPLQHSQSPKPSSRRALQLRGPEIRPAQLETEDFEGESELFKARKRALDSLYKKARKGHTLRPPPSVVSLEKYFDGITSVAHESANREPADTLKLAPRNLKTRFRKHFVPRLVDVAAPQYAHANDPITTVKDINMEQEDACVDPITSKERLQGLGPYGTVYTQHFEIFPLDQGIYFHTSTLIGRGSITRAIDPGYYEKLRHVRPRISFVLDGRTLLWGPWDDRTSSEFGILIDWVCDKLGPAVNRAEMAGTGDPVDAADFIVTFLLDSLSLQGEDEEKALILRCSEVMESFVARSEALQQTALEMQQTCAEVFVRFTIAAMILYQLVVASGCDFSVTCQFEGILTRMAKLCIRTLLNIGLDDVRKMYGDLQRLSSRERGIRPDQYTVSCWVVVMRVLENVHIPRSSFWDIAASVMLQSENDCSSDARQFEEAWQNMFSLLPLSEFDDSGILVSGLRHTLPMEGWILPQRLSKRVFDLYRNNPRQSPSFNEYCRAILARCHYLVQQWGWSNCRALIGTVFDFFGSQNLAHLRNEEVHQSPSFLEKLSANPSLAIEPEDRCFHIFLKTLALAIQRLKKQDRINDIDNLKTRTLPNHNRQYKKEDTIHQHDLAALRNHHDLLCTLFWAAPPDYRPALRFIEELVTPESSHKEAVLINIRAWGQLAGFIISTSEGSMAYKPFILWQQNVFNHLLDQYLSAAADIEQQFRALSGQGRGITTAMKDQMILRNKAAAMDGLYTSMKTSLRVLKQGNSLGITAYALSTYQLRSIFSKLDYSSPDFDWSIVRVALDTVEYYLNRLDEAKSAADQYSSEKSHDTDPQELEDAVQLLDVRLVEAFFSMGRKVLRLPPAASLRRANEQATCIEKTVVIGAGIATIFFKDRVTLLASYFTTPKYGLFTQLPKNLESGERKYLSLFLATLIKNHIYSFDDLGSTLLELWVLAIIKPLRYLQYENYLARFLKQNGLPFLQRAAIPATAPDYTSNLDYFLCAIHHVRKTLREAGLAEGRQLRERYRSILNLSMSKMKKDLQDLVSNPAEHKAYMAFVRKVISTIKSHGVGISIIDPFFTQPSVEYSPPVQDPQLHIDGIIGYGVKIGEKDYTATPQLFHYLYNNFKIALANGKLKDERGILEMALFNSEILSFMLQFMLPAIIEATARVKEAWPLLEVYVAALGSILTRSCIPMELRGVDLEHSGELLQAIIWWFLKLRDSNEALISLEHAQMTADLIQLANAQQFSLQTWLCAPRQSIDNAGDGNFDSTQGARDAVQGIESLTREGRRYLQAFLAQGQPGEQGGESMLRAGLQLVPLLAGLPQWDSPSVMQNPRVMEFANHIVGDVGRTWVVTPGLVTIRMAGKPASSASGSTPTTAGSQSCNGTTYGPWTVKELAQKACASMGRWKLKMPPFLVAKREFGSRLDRRPNGRVSICRGLFEEDELVF